MQAPLTLGGAVCAASLCLYSIGMSHDAGPVRHDRDQAYPRTMLRAEAVYRAAQDACERKDANTRDLCFREAKATHIRAITDARAPPGFAEAAGAKRGDAVLAR